MILLVNNSKSNYLVVFYCKRCIKSLIKMQEHVSMISNLSCFICILYKKLNYPKVFKLKYYKRHTIKKNITWFLLLNTGNLKYTVELLEFLVVQISWYSWYSQVNVSLNHELAASTKKKNYGCKVTFPFVDSYQRIHENTFP